MLNGIGENTSLGFDADPTPARVTDQRDFARALAVENRLNDSAGDAERARDAAERLVSATFIEPLLAQMRESSQAAPPFAPTQAEKQLRALADTMTAQRIVRAARMPLVDRIAADLMARTPQPDSSGLESF